MGANLVQLSSPILVKTMVFWILGIDNTAIFIVAGILVALGSLLLLIMHTIVFENGVMISNKIASKINQLMRMMIYQRLINMRIEFRNELHISTINNLVLVDSFAIQVWLNLLPHIIVAPIATAICLTYIAISIGYRAMLSFLVVFIVSLGLYLLNNRQIKFEKKIMILLDRKNKLISEYLEQVKDMKIDGLTSLYRRKL